jgi:hypothetical protein
MVSCNEDTITVMGAIVSSLLIVSEVLPYIKSTDGNGLIHIAIKILNNMVNAKKTNPDLLGDATDLPV